MFKLKSGFTMLELLIAMAVLAIILTTAVPSLSQFIQSREIDQQASAIITTLSTARSVALSQASAASVCWNDTGSAVSLPAPNAAANIEPGIMVFIDPIQATIATRVKTQISFLNDGYNVINNFTAVTAGTAQCVNFGSQGRSTTPGSFVLCKTNGIEANAVTIQLNINGRANQIDGNQIAGVSCV